MKYMIYLILAYLLYDLLSSETNGNFDTLDQTIFDSLPGLLKNILEMYD